MKGGKPDYSLLELPKLEELAEEGNADAQWWLGRRLFYGEGCPEDRARGEEWVEKAAHQGVADAQVLMGDLAYGMEEIEEAGNWWLLAADANHPKALYWLGMLCLEVNPPEHLQAVLNFEDAAEAGSADAMTALGKIYLRGEGSEKRSPAKALRWFKRAAKRGEWLAMGYLADMYRDGVGVKVDRAKAAEYRRQSEIGEAKEELLAGSARGRSEPGNGR